MCLAITGDFKKYESKSLRDFIYDSYKSGRVLYVDSYDSIAEFLSR
jgi:hypothetical protein